MHGSTITVWHGINTAYMQSTMHGTIFFRAVLMAGVKWCVGWGVGIGLETEFRSEKFPRNRLGMIFVIPRKKAFILFHGMVRNGIPRICFFWFHGTEFRVVFSSAEGFGTELWGCLTHIRVYQPAPLYMNPNARGGREVAESQPMRTAVHRSPNKLWRSNFILLLFLLHGTEFWVVFSSAEGFGTENSQP